MQPWSSEGPFQAAKGDSDPLPLDNVGDAGSVTTARADALVPRKQAPTWLRISGSRSPRSCFVQLSPAKQTTGSVVSSQPQQSLQMAHSPPRSSINTQAAFNLAGMPPLGWGERGWSWCSGRGQRKRQGRGLFGAGGPHSAQAAAERQCRATGRRANPDLEGRAKAGCRHPSPKSPPPRGCVLSWPLRALGVPLILLCPGQGSPCHSQRSRSHPTLRVQS